MKYLRILSKTRAIINKIFNDYNKYGTAQYTISEPITIKQHSIQSARYMQKIRNTPIAITSALLHDYGHVSQSFEPIDPTSGIDDRHEWVAAKQLRRLGFPNLVYMPIGYHVMAKRYLASVDKEYKAKLTEGSRLSLELQGGTLTDLEIKKFENNMWFSTAILLRESDDKGKNENIDDDNIEEFRQILELALNVPSIKKL